MGEVRRTVYELIIVDRQTDEVLETLFVAGANKPDAVARAAQKIKTDISDRRHTVLVTEIESYDAIEPTLIKNVE